MTKKKNKSIVKSDINDDNHQILSKEINGIVLVMIVKNESRIIKRCLNTVLPIIKKGKFVNKSGGICITDTGSTDNTVDCIKQWAKENEVCCEVPSGNFNNFSYARTLSFLNGLKYFPNAKYFLLIDADMELVVKDTFNLDDLTAPSYDLYQQTYYSRYKNIRLISPTYKWKCVGVTHEYWKSDSNTQTIYTGLEINDRDDGGCKSDKYERDRRLLLEGIADKKTSNDLKMRYRFYLAQTYKCLKRYDEAIAEYQKRVDMGGWHEEVWFSLYTIGMLYIEMGEKADNSNQSDKAEEYYARGVYTLLKAYDFRPQRPESILTLAEHYRKKSKNKIALHFAELAQSSGYPHEDGLFIDVATYSYKIDYEIAINAYYVPGKKSLGYQAQRRLMQIYDKLPLYVKCNVDNNNKFYQC